MFLKNLPETNNWNADFFKNPRYNRYNLSVIFSVFTWKEEKNVETLEVIEAGILFSSPHKSYKRAKHVSEVDDFDSDIVRTVHAFYDRRKYPTAQPYNLLLLLKDI